MSALVGREQPTAVLDAEVERTLTSHGGLVLVTGEAGIGKSSLVAEAVTTARAGGALVAVGTCWERDGAPDHWPWVQVLRAVSRAATDEAWAEARAAAGGDVDVLLGAGAASAGSGAVDAFALHDATTALLISLAREVPVVVVVEDLHWADEASLRLLEFAARHGWYERLLLVGTYRDVEVETGDHPRASVLASLATKATAVSLTGLGRDEVATLVARTTDQAPTDDVVDELLRRTGGNPFFVEQTARLWRSRGTTTAVPPGVREAVRHRLELVSPGCRHVLATAALLGHRTTRPVLAAAVAAVPAPRAIAGFDPDDAMTEADVARLLVAEGEEGLVFVHDLVRETLVADRDDEDVGRSHAALVGALAAPTSGGGVGPGDLAHHAHRAGDALPVDRRLELLRAAAAEATGRMALDEAAQHLGRALAILPEDARRERAFTLVERGWLVMRLGDIDGTRAHFEEATRIALDLDDPALLTRSALSLRAAVWLVASDEVHLTATEMVDEAHRRLVVEGGLPTLASTSWEREQELTSIAVEMCRSSEDDKALWDALSVRHDAIWVPGTVEERLAIVDEMIEVARRNGWAGHVLEAHGLRLCDLIEAGDPRLADEHVTFEARARQIDSGWSRASARWAGALLAVVAGRFDDARTLLDEARAVETRAGLTGEDVDSLHLQVRWAVEHQQGHDDTVDALLDQIAEVHPHPEVLRAITALDRGDVARGARTVAELRGSDAEPGRWFAPVWLRLRAMVAGATGDPAAIQEVRAELDDLRGTWALMAQSAPDGPFDLWAGVVEAGAGCWPEAIAHFEAARSSAEGIGARAWAVEARWRAVEARLAVGEDRAVVVPDAVTVARDARHLGMARVVARMEAIGGDRGAPPPIDEPAATGPRFRRRDDVWELAWDGSSVHVADAKGLRDIHSLLGRPGMGVRAVDLLAPDAGATGRAAASMGGDEALDERAKAAYRTRLGQLDEEIDAALARRDDPRAAELDRERAALIDELRRATGLGGRSRRLGDDAERARKAVRERIRDTIRRLDPVHPALAAHLRATVKTGATCSYDPTEPIAWAL